MIKATVETNELKKALDKANLIKKRQSLPILSQYAHAKLNDNKMTITTTDLGKVIRVEVDSNNSENGTLLLPRYSINKFLYSGKEIKQDKTIISNGSKVDTLKIEREKIGKLNLHTTPEKEYPPIPYAEKLEYKTFDAKWLCNMLKIVSHACAGEISRPVLTGVVFSDGAIAAADGFRLGLLKDSRLFFGLGKQQAIIDKETIDFAIRLFAKEEKLYIAFEYVDDTSFPQSDKPKPQILRRVYFKSGNTSLMSELIQGTYPNYEQLIPGGFICKVSVSTPLLMQRINMINVKEIGSGILRLIFHKNEENDNECLIQSHLADDEYDDSYNLTMPIKLLSTDYGKIAVNHKYLTEAIKPFSICNIAINSPSSPLIITGDIEGLTILVMPMFVQW